MADIKLYGAPWCPDCKRSKKFLAEHRVVFDWIDIDQDAEARRYVEELQHGGRSIPTIVFADGSHLIEPTDDELARKLVKGKGKLQEVVARDRVSGELYTWHPAAAFVFIGLDPSTAFLRGRLELDRWGFIVTGANYETSLPGVFAAGDVRQGSTKQLGSAAGEGIAAILQVREHLRRARQLTAVAVNE